MAENDDLFTEVQDAVRAGRPAAAGGAWRARRAAAIAAAAHDAQVALGALGAEKGLRPDVTPEAVVALRLAADAMPISRPGQQWSGAADWLRRRAAAFEVATRDAATAESGAGGWTHEEAKHHTLVERLHERCALYGGSTCADKVNLAHEDWCERCLAAEALTRLLPPADGDAHQDMPNPQPPRETAGPDPLAYLHQLQTEAERGFHRDLRAWVDDGSSVARALTQYATHLTATSGD